jgi:FixJ family two-component response regulator
MPHNVSIIDDDPSTCRALKRLLTVAGYSASTYNSANAYLEEKEIHSDCILLDVHMPGLDGFGFQESLKSLQNPSPIIFLTGRGDVPMSVRAMRAGASDFLLKPVDESDLISAIDRAIANVNHGSTQKRGIQKERLAKLTTREKQVLDEILTGALNKQIADTLQIAERTVKMHRGRVMRKLDAKNLLDLAAYKPS